MQALCWWWFWRSCWPAVIVCVGLTTLLPLTFYDFTWPSTEHIANIAATACLLLGYAIMRDRHLRIWQCVLLGILTCAMFHVRQNVVLAAALPVLAIFSVAQPVRQRIMGFCIFLPFLMVDLVISSVLTSMGMVMMPPALISALFKILLFVLADGWHLVTLALGWSFR